MRNRSSAVDASVNQFTVPADDDRRHPTESKGIHAYVCMCEQNSHTCCVAQLTHVERQRRENCNVETIKKK